MKKFSLNKNERLKSKTEISRLFKDGKFLYTSNFKIGWIYDEKEGESSIKTAVSVPKRNFKLAVDRNRLKRQIKEIYRLNKEIITSTVQNSKFTVNVIIIYTAKEKISYNVMLHEIVSLLQKLSKKIEKIS